MLFRSRGYSRRDLYRFFGADVQFGTVRADLFYAQTRVEEKAVKVVRGYARQIRGRSNFQFDL